MRSWRDAFLYPRSFSAASSGPLLILHDTTEFSDGREETEAIGILQKMPTMYAEDGPATLSHPMRRPDALQPGGDRSGASSRARRHQVLPKGQGRIDGKQITDLPARFRKDAVQKLRWYAMRWKNRDLPQDTSGIQGLRGINSLVPGAILYCREKSPWLIESARRLRESM